MSVSSAVWQGTMLAVGLASALPLAATWWLASRPRLTALWVPRLIFVASGALFGAALFHLIPEALVVSSPAWVATLVAVGIGALALMERAVHAMEPGVLAAATAHPAPAIPIHSAHGHASHLMPLGIASDALHNMIDGALVATAFLADPSLGIFAGVAIAMHELPRELGTFALCVQGGMSPYRAILVNAVTGVLAMAGALLALAVGADAQRFGALLLPFAAGNFLYLAIAILWAKRTALRSPERLRLVGLVMAGVVVTSFLAFGR